MKVIQIKCPVILKHGGKVRESVLPEWCNTADNVLSISHEYPDKENRYSICSLLVRDDDEVKTAVKGVETISKVSSDVRVNDFITAEKIEKLSEVKYIEPVYTIAKAVK